MLILLALDDDRVAENTERISDKDLKVVAKLFGCTENVEKWFLHERHEEINVCRQFDAGQADLVVIAYHGVDIIWA